MILKKEVICILIVILVFLVACFQMCNAEDLLYIRTHDQFDGEKGTQSQSGHIVDIRPKNSTTVPSRVAKEEWAIIEVPNLSKEDKVKYTSVDEKENFYRKYYVDNLESLNLNSKGLREGTYNWELVKGNIKEHTDKDSQDWDNNKIAYNNQKLYWRIAEVIMPGKLLYAATTINVSTINHPGEDYDTLTLWEDATDYNLVAATTIEIASCFATDGVLDQSVTVTYAGAITSILYYRKITAPEGERHDGTISGNGFTIRLTGDVNTAIINEDNFKMDWVRSDGNSATGRRLFYTTGDNTRVRYCMGYNMNLPAMQIASPANGTIIENTIIYDVSLHGLFVDTGATSTTTTCYNVTIYGNAANDGFEVNNAGASLYLYNCLAYNISGDDFKDNGNGQLYNYYCMSEDATADDYNGDHNFPNASVTFVNAAGGDLHLQWGVTKDDAIDVGNDYSGSMSAAVDIDNESRPWVVGGTWDIGADELYYPDPEPVEMIWDIGGGDNDYIGTNGLATWEDETDEADYTLISTAVYSHTGAVNKGAMTHGDVVTGSDSGATGIVVGQVTSTQILLRSISGTFQDGEQVSIEPDLQYIILSNSGNSAIAVAEGYEATEADTDLNVFGAGTDEFNYRSARAALGEQFEAKVVIGDGSGAGWRMRPQDGGSRDHGIHILEDNFILKGLRVCEARHHGIRIEDALNVTIDRCFSHNIDNTASPSVEPHGIFVSGTCTGIIKNCMIANINSNSFIRHSAAIDPGNLIVDSCTIWNITNTGGGDGYGIHDSGDAKVINTICMGTTTFDFIDDNFGGWGSGTGYNMSEDTSAPGGSSLTEKDPSQQFVSIVTLNEEDLRLKILADALDVGNTDLEEDIEGTERPQPEFGDKDMGADEYVVVITPTPTQTQTPTVTATPTQTQTFTPTQTQTVTATNTQTSTQTNTQTATQTVTATPTQTITPDIVDCYRHEKYTVYFDECQTVKAIYVECETYEVVYYDCETYEAYYYYGSR